MAARALQFAVMCCARSGEVRGMTWAEVDLGEAPRATRATSATQGAVWTIPASRMKAEREHRVRDLVGRQHPEDVRLVLALVDGTEQRAVP